MAATTIAVIGLALAAAGTAVTVSEGRRARREAKSEQRKQVKRQNAAIQTRRRRESELRRFAGIRAARARTASAGPGAPRGGTIMTSPTGTSTIGESPQSTKQLIGL